MTGQDASDTVGIGMEAARNRALIQRSQWLCSWQGRAHVAVSTVAGFLLLCLTAFATLLVAVCTLFQKRRFYTEVMTRWLALAFLRLLRVKLVVLPEQVFPRKQVMYVFNHPSSLDMFILLSLGLPDTRYFLSGKLRQIVPLGVIAWLMGTFFTPPQSRPAARAECFQHADDVLRRTGASVCLSPEGTRITDGSIGRFNKGSFHLATSLKVPIVPLYIEIPPGIDPGKGWKVAPGTVQLHILPEIRTEEWSLADLEQNREKVRSVYVEFHKKRTSAALAASPWQPGAAQVTEV